MKAADHVKQVCAVTQQGFLQSAHLISRKARNVRHWHVCVPARRNLTSYYECVHAPTAAILRKTTQHVEDWPARSSKRSKVQLQHLRHAHQHIEDCAVVSDNA